MQKLQLLKDTANYFGSMCTYNLIVRCKPILKTLKCEKMPAEELRAKVYSIEQMWTLLLLKPCRYSLRIWTVFRFECLDNNCVR